jgi:DNA-binding XRE family transcriptional regulator
MNTRKEAARAPSPAALLLRPIGEHADQVARLIGEAQIIAIAEAGELVVLTAADLDDMIEDAGATAAYHRTRGQETLPAELVDRLLAGENPVKIWRDHRGLTQQALADQAGIKKAYLSQLEGGSRAGTVAVRRRLAAALGVDLGDLI